MAFHVPIDACFHSSPGVVVLFPYDMFFFFPLNDFEGFWLFPDKTL